MQNYRLTMEQLNRVYPEKEFLTITDISRFLGVTRTTAVRRFPALKKNELKAAGATKTQLALMIERSNRKC